VIATGLATPSRCGTAGHRHGVREGPYRRQRWSTQIVDVGAGQLLDIVPGRDAIEPCRWLAAQPAAWWAGIAWATLDLSASYRTLFDTMLPEAVQVADPFHVVRVANTALDECRRRVQNDTIGLRGRRPDPLYPARRLLTIAAERLPDDRRERSAVGESRSWPGIAPTSPTGRPKPSTNLLKRVKRVAFGIRRFRNYRSAPSSTPADPTGPCSTPSPHQEIRST
jgi:transposase